VVNKDNYLCVEVELIILNESCHSWPTSFFGLTAEYRLYCQLICRAARTLANACNGCVSDAAAAAAADVAVKIMC